MRPLSAVAVLLLGVLLALFSSPQASGVRLGAAPRRSNILQRLEDPRPGQVHHLVQEVLDEYHQRRQQEQQLEAVAAGTQRHQVLLEQQAEGRSSVFADHRDHALQQMFADEKFPLWPPSQRKLRAEEELRLKRQQQPQMLQQTNLDDPLTALLLETGETMKTAEGDGSSAASPLLRSYLQRSGRLPAAPVHSTLSPKPVPRKQAAVPQAPSLLEVEQPAAPPLSTSAAAAAAAAGTRHHVFLQSSPPPQPPLRPPPPPPQSPEGSPSSSSSEEIPAETQELL